MIKNFLYYFNKILRPAYALIFTSKNNHLFCRICGLEQDDYPWGEDGKTASFDICVCCGAEFGYEDSILTGIKEYRNKWVKNDYKWLVPKFKPENWDPQKQMKNIPPEFRLMKRRFLYYFNKIFRPAHAEELISNSMCRVCGKEYDGFPWGEDGKTASFELCVCCGAEFGYEDCTPSSTKKFRQKWIENGYNWFYPKSKPENWDPQKQMENIPPEFR